MPIDCPEPFGLVVIEAMACGTPVIAFPFGSMPELIEPGVNGALVESVDQAVAAVEGWLRSTGGCAGVHSNSASPWLAWPRTTSACTRRSSRRWCRRPVDPRCPSKVSQSRFLRAWRPRSGSFALGSTQPASTGPPNCPGQHRGLRNEGQSTSRHLRYPGSARGADSLRIALPPDGGIAARIALLSISVSSRSS
jgi:Glycosyl transferases group 1